MPANVIDEFVAVFRLNLDDLKSGAKQADAETKRLKDSQKKTFDQIEESGKRTGEAIKGVTREVIGLGLAFMGARSIVGFAANLASGAASADRFGQKLLLPAGGRRTLHARMNDNATLPFPGGLLGTGLSCIGFV